MQYTHLRKPVDRRVACAIDDHIARSCDRVSIVLLRAWHPETFVRCQTAARNVMAFDLEDVKPRHQDHHQIYEGNHLPRAERTSSSVRMTTSNSVAPSGS